MTAPAKQERRLRFLRERAGLSMGDLARSLGCSVEEVSLLEHDLRDPVTGARSGP